jgi:hypothetical protein
VHYAKGGEILNTSDSDIAAAVSAAKIPTSRFSRSAKMHRA